MVMWLVRFDVKLKCVNSWNVVVSCFCWWWCLVVMLMCGVGGLN